MRHPFLENSLFLIIINTNPFVAPLVKAAQLFKKLKNKNKR